MRRVAATVAAAALAAAPTANAHELTISQKRVYKHRWQISSFVLRWYTGNGRWTLRPRFDRCAELRWEKPRARCYRHRSNYRWHAARMAHIGRLLWPPRPAAPSYSSVPAAICAVFGPYCQQALAVARCESGFSTTARNGQYEGIFQLGSSERATYGDASDAYGQARAAFRYFAASGYSWGPWECRP